MRIISGENRECVLGRSDLLAKRRHVLGDLVERLFCLPQILHRRFAALDAEFRQLYVFLTHGNGLLGEGEDVIEFAQPKIRGCNVGDDGCQHGVRRRLRFEKLIARRAGGRCEFAEEIHLIGDADA